MHFSEQERAIYAYSDGANEVRGDPLAIHRRLVQAAGGDLEALVARAQPAWLPTGPQGKLEPPREDPQQLVERLAAEDTLLLCVRIAFALPETLPDACVWHVWNDWGHWRAGERRPAGTTPTSRQSSVSRPAASTTVPECGCS
jgi:hypothetical protein